MVEGDVLAQPTDDDLLARELRRHLEAPAPREMVASRLTVRVSSTASAMRRSGGAARREVAEADTVSHGPSRHTRVALRDVPHAEAEARPKVGALTVWKATPSSPMEVGRQAAR